MTKKLKELEKLLLIKKAKWNVIKAEFDKNEFVMESILEGEIINSIKHKKEIESANDSFIKLGEIEREIVELKEEIRNAKNAQELEKIMSDKWWEGLKLKLEVVNLPIAILGGLIGVFSVFYTLYTSQQNERIQSEQLKEIQSLRQNLMQNYQTIKGFESKQKEINQKISLIESKKK
jgi:hypothetical protein